jgi:hypothetical protein
MSGKDKENNEWDGWYLVRAYHKDADPFVTVMDLPREEVLDIYKKIAPIVVENLAKGNDQLKKRREFENWLREGARTSGVDVRKENPVHFVLTRDPEAYAGAVLQPMPDAPQLAERKIIVIPVSEANLSACSFTYAPHRDVSRSVDDVLCNAKQIAEVLKTSGGLDATGRYIRAQMWDRPSVDVSAATEVTKPVKLMDGDRSSGRFVYAGKARP